MSAKRRKVVVVGAGSVGTTYIYALLQTGLAAEIALLDVDKKRVEGELMDLSHGLPFIPPVLIHAGSYTGCCDAHMIVITAGAKRRLVSTAPIWSEKTPPLSNPSATRSQSNQRKQY